MLAPSLSTQTIPEETISRVSHNVPDPFRKTSSGFNGIILQREKIKGWIYFIYK
jgi:hypothetical protein